MSIHTDGENNFFLLVVSSNPSASSLSPFKEIRIHCHLLEQLVARVREKSGWLGRFMQKVETVRTMQPDTGSEVVE